MKRKNTLAQHWSRRIATRSGLVVMLATIPLFVGALISAGGGASLLPTGFGSLTSGPPEQTTLGAFERPKAAETPGVQAQVLLALVETARGKQAAKKTTIADNGTTTTTPVGAFAAPPSGTETTPDEGGGDNSGGGGQGSGPKVPAKSGVGGSVGQAVGSLLDALLNH